MFPRKLAALATFITCCSAAAAFAEPTKADIQKAEDHFRKGAEWYAQGDYAKAVVEFKFGHNLAPNAMFLYNMSLAYERLESFDEAIEVAQEARRMGGMPEEIARRNEARIVGFYTILSARGASRDIAAAAVAKNDDDEVIDDPIEGPVLVDRADGITTLGFVGTGLAVVGGGFALGGFLTNNAVNDDIDQLRIAASTRDTVTYNELKEDLPKKQARGKALYAIGGAAAGLGMILFVTDLVVGTESVEVGTALRMSPEGPSANATLRF